MSNHESKITSLTFLSKKNNCFSIELDNGSNYTIHSDYVVKYKIKKNSFVDERVLEQALVQTEKQQIKNKIILLLSYRLRSKKELTDSLISKGFNSNNVIDVINDLVERKYIDNFRFAKMYATHLIKEKKLGKRIVEKKLEHHEIDSQTIEDVISALYKKYCPAETINAIIKKKKNLFKGTDLDKKKLINYLMRKGFHFDDIEVAIESRF